MAVSKVAFAAVGLACIAAAGAGGYFALHENAASEPTPTAAAAPAAAVEHAAAPVRDTEPVVAPPAKPVNAPKKVTAPPRAAEKPVAQVAKNSGVPKLLPTAPLAPQPPLPDPPAPAPLPSRTDPVEHAAQESLPSTQPQHTFDELVISSDSVIGLQSDTTVTSERARVEDRVEARVTRDVRVADRVAIPAGSRAIGYVTQVERGGKFKEQARLAIRFQTIVLADGTRLPISTAAVEREGDAKGNSSAAKVGGAAIAGTILGAILGGGKGAAVGGLAGAGAGAAATQAGDRSIATLRSGEPITIRLLSPVTVTTESK